MCWGGGYIAESAADSPSTEADASSSTGVREELRMWWVKGEGEGEGEGEGGGGGGAEVVVLDCGLTRVCGSS